MSNLPDFENPSLAQPPKRATRQRSTPRSRALTKAETLQPLGAIGALIVRYAAVLLLCVGGVGSYVVYRTFQADLDVGVTFMLVAVVAAPTILAFACAGLCLIASELMVAAFRSIDELREQTHLLTAIVGRGRASKRAP